MKIIAVFTLFLLSPTLATAAIYKAGDVVPFEFDTLFPTGDDPSSVIDLATVGYLKVFELNNLVDYKLAIRLFEDNDPSSIPFASATVVEPVAGMTFLGLSWPTDTWSDLNGLIELEVIQGAITNPSFFVRIENEGTVYSSIPPVPVPAPALLFLGGLFSLSGTTKYLHRKKYNVEHKSSMISADAGE